MRCHCPFLKVLVEKCLFSLKSKLLKNTQLKADYLKFMSEIVSSGDDEVVVMNSAPDNRESWYIPHFAVCHPKKPDSLNDHLLTTYLSDEPSSPYCSQT